MSDHTTAAAVAERTSVTNSDLVRTGPGTLAGRYLRMFWQPVARAQDIAPGRALPVQVMGESVTVYRGEGGDVHVVQGRCPHRGTPLSVGWVEGDAIRCRYHGWCFGSDGQCIEQPGEDPAFAQKISIRRYPAEEYLGLVFAYLGEGIAPPLRRYRDFEREGVLVAGPTEVWPCNYFNRIDNACDVGHSTFTHRASILRTGNTWQLGVREITSVEAPYGIRTAYVLPERPATYFHFHMPNTNQGRARGRVEGTLEDAATLTVDRLFWHVPIDDGSCVTYVVDYLPLTGADAEAYRARRSESETTGLMTPNAVGAEIIEGKRRVEDVDPNASNYKLFWVEDYVVQVGQDRISDRREEHLGRIDVGVILLRKLWRRELQALADGEPLQTWVTPSGLAEMSDGVAAVSRGS